MAGKRRIYCFAEDRESADVGLRLAIASLKKACPTAEIIVYRPNASQSFLDWLSSFRDIRWINGFPAGSSGWNCKPQCLLPLLDEGADEAIWIDSDMLITRDPNPIWDQLNDDTFVGTEEPASSPGIPGWHARAKGWGLPLGNECSTTLNSSILRVTARHRLLLHCWSELLDDPAYIAAQNRPMADRPHHFLGDQDVLNAVLGSQQFSDLKVDYLKIGREIIHCGGALGYPLFRRFKSLLNRTPTFLHAISGKPWWVLTDLYAQQHSKWFTFYRRILQETSDYVIAAKQFEEMIQIPCPWLHSHSWMSRVLNFFSLGSHALRGLPLVTVATFASTLNRLRTR